MSTTRPAGADHLSIGSKVAFGLGNAGEQVVAVTVSSYAMLYYNQVLGLPAYLAGIAMSASLIADGLSDPVAGGLSDRTRSRLGRRHPYMYFSPVIIGLAFLALWNPPAGLGQAALFWWFLVSVSALRWSLSFYETPRMALGGELSSDYAERSNVMGYNQLIGFAGTFATTWIALTYFFKKTPEYPRGLLNPEPWSRYSLFMVVLMVVTMYACALWTHGRIRFLPKPPAHLPRFSPFEFLKDIGKVLSNRNFTLLLVGFFFVSMMVGLRTALHIYVNTFFWGLTSEELRWMLLGTFAGIFTAFVVVPRLHARLDKKWTIVAGTSIYAIAPSIPVWLGMAGIMKPGDPQVLAVVVSFGALTAAVQTLSLTSVLSVLGDIADENEVRYGVRQEGALYATRALFGKVEQGIGAAFAGLVLTLIAFPAKAKVGAIPDGVLHDLLIWDGVIAVLPGLVAGLPYILLRTNRRTYEATRETLRRLREDPNVSPLAEGVVEPSGVPDWRRGKS